MASIITAFVIGLFFEAPKRKKELAKERLEKFYAPVLGRLKANEAIWHNFTSTLWGTDDLFKADQALIRILSDSDSRRDEYLNKWVAAMEGIFRQYNEATERIILEHSGYLRPEDADENSEFDKERKQYLRHVGEFKATLHHWDQARKDNPTYSWYQRLVKSIGSATTSSSATPTATQFLEYFHPTNGYPENFLLPVQQSYSQLMHEAGLVKK